MKEAAAVQILLKTGAMDDRNLFLPVVLTKSTTERSVGKIVTGSGCLNALTLILAFRYYWTPNSARDKSSKNSRYISLSNDRLNFSELDNTGSFTSFEFDEIEKFAVPDYYPTRWGSDSLECITISLKKGTAITFEFEKANFSMLKHIHSAYQSAMQANADVLDANFESKTTV